MTGAVPPAAIIAQAERDAVAARCVALVARALKLPHRDVTIDAEFARDLAADSIDMVTIAMLVEDEFGIDISDADAADCETVRDMVDVVLCALAERAEAMAVAGATC